MEKLREICSKTFTPEEMQMLDRAIEFTKGVHAHQTRHSGEPYYTHPESVAIMLANMGMDSHTILAGLMHDVIEDGKDITYEKLASMFGQDIAGMVDGVTKLTKTGKNEMISREDIQAESFRKMFLAIANDIRVVIIKLNDRLHNMRTLQYCSEEKQIRKARETLDIYAPLAHRFGMGAMKCELEDLCMKYLWPEEYKKLIHRLNRIEGQIRGIRGMVENDAYCPDILVQSAAAGAALNAFNKELLASHIRTCVVEDIRDGKDEVIDELVATLQKLMK